MTCKKLYSITQTVHICRCGILSIIVGFVGLNNRQLLLPEFCTKISSKYLFARMYYHDYHVPRVII